MKQEWPKVNVSRGKTEARMVRGGSIDHVPWYSGGQVYAALYREGKLVETDGPVRAEGSRLGFAGISLCPQTGDVLHIEDRKGTTLRQHYWFYVVWAEEEWVWLRSMPPVKEGTPPRVTREEFMLALAEEVSGSLQGLDEEESKTVTELALLRPELRGKRLKKLLDG